jgi:ubiquinone/menaquinone biosynthesis C-methylase UbiE
MASVELNRERWTNYDWANRGDEWSVGFGGTDVLWQWAIQPRVAAYLPAEHVLEIAPGHGRVTQYLVPAATRLTLVDLVEPCIQACRERFGSYDHISYHVNDGRSLDMVADESVDFVFSWDSLVHAEADVLRDYVAQLARKLKPGGAGLLHHSNLGAYRDPRTGELTVDNQHWRASSMSALTFRDFCRAARLRVVAQELIPWGGLDFIDCVSVFRREEPGSWSRVYKRAKLLRNEHFADQIQQRQAAGIRRLARLFRP